MSHYKTTLSEAVNQATAAEFFWDDGEIAGRRAIHGVRAEGGEVRVYSARHKDWALALYIHCDMSTISTEMVHFMASEEITLLDSGRAEVKFYPTVECRPQDAKSALIEFSKMVPMRPEHFT